ncbi:MAG: LysM peptidoglycan-binding domain-containing protein [Candidatus Eisenbacteria bacterium]|nr:LysM peptidoglycan-binding domain-containing protein [Candidatus Eisenbacteria bacterium]
MGKAGSLSAAALVATAVLLSGCGTGGIAVKKDIWDAQEEFSTRQAGLSEKVLQLEGRIGGVEESVAALEHRIGNLSSQVAGIDAQLARGLEAVRSGQQQLGIELEGKIRSTDAARKSDRDDVLRRLEIVLDEVTKENKRLTAELDAVKAATSDGSSHTVSRGETLAGIAAKYGVTVSALMSANSISDPNLIRVGQKLVVPR